MDDFELFLQEQMKNPEFKHEWEASQLEFEITELLISARQEQHISQKELAAKTGIRQSNLSRIERGQCKPDLTTLQKIASGLGKKLQIQFI
jgi:ribosome-binding protein aMBF1 (putative translation factor)